MYYCGLSTVLRISMIQSRLMRICKIPWPECTAYNVQRNLDVLNTFSCQCRWHERVGNDGTLENCSKVLRRCQTKLRRYQGRNMHWANIRVTCRKLQKCDWIDASVVQSHLFSHSSSGRKMVSYWLFTRRFRLYPQYLDDNFVLIFSSPLHYSVLPTYYPSPSSRPLYQLSFTRIVVPIYSNLSLSQ